MLHLQNSLKLVSFRQVKQNRVHLSPSLLHTRLSKACHGHPPTARRLAHRTIPPVPHAATLVAHQGLLLPPRIHPLSHPHCQSRLTLTVKTVIVIVKKLTTPAYFMIRGVHLRHLPLAILLDPHDPASSQGACLHVAHGHGETEREDSLCLGVEQPVELPLLMVWSGSGWKDVILYLMKFISMKVAQASRPMK